MRAVGGSKVQQICFALRSSVHDDPAGQVGKVSVNGRRDQQTSHTTALIRVVSTPQVEAWHSLRNRSRMWLLAAARQWSERAAARCTHTSVGEEVSPEPPLLPRRTALMKQVQTTVNSLECYCMVLYHVGSHGSSAV